MGAGYGYLPKQCQHTIPQPPPAFKNPALDRELEKANQAYKDIESCKNHLAKHKPAPVWMFWRWFLIVNLGTALTVSATNIEAKEAELVWMAMWEEKPHIVEFKFDAELREFKARINK